MIRARRSSNHLVRPKLGGSRSVELESVSRLQLRPSCQPSGANCHRCVNYMDGELARMHRADDTESADYRDMLFMRAYLPLTWVMMARTSEIRLLKNNMIRYDLPHRLFGDEENGRHMEIRLVFRKTNQADPNKANVYQVFDDAEEPAAHVRLPLENWRNYVRKRSHANLADHPDALLFPTFDAAGTPKFLQHWGNVPFYKIYRKVIDGSGVEENRWGPGTFRAHSMRRGCAQHRAMFVLPGKRWSLEQIRWWGGWAPSESNEVLMRYLIESHDRQQNYYGDSMDPYRNFIALNTHLHGTAGPQAESVARHGDLQVVEQRVKQTILDLRIAMQRENQLILDAIQSLKTTTFIHPALLRPTSTARSVENPSGETATATASSSHPQADSAAEETGPDAPSSMAPDIDMTEDGDDPGLRFYGVPRASSIPECIELWEKPKLPFHPYAMKDWPRVNPGWVQAAKQQFSNRKRIYDAFVEQAGRSYDKYYELFGTGISASLENVRLQTGKRQRYRSTKIKVNPIPRPAGPRPRVQPRGIAVSDNDGDEESANEDDGEIDRDSGSDEPSPRTLAAQVEAAERAEQAASSQERPPPSLSINTQTTAILQGAGQTGLTEEELNVRALMAPGGEDSPDTAREKAEAEAAQAAAAKSQMLRPASSYEPPPRPSPQPSPTPSTRATVVRFVDPPPPSNSSAPSQPWPPHAEGLIAASVRPPSRATRQTRR